MIVHLIQKKDKKYFMFSKFSRRKFEINKQMLYRCIGKKAEQLYDYYDWFYVESESIDQVWQTLKLEETTELPLDMEGKLISDDVLYSIVKKFSCGKTKLTCAHIDKKNLKNPLATSSCYVQSSDKFLKYSHVIKFETSFLNYEFFASDAITMSYANKKGIKTDISEVNRNDYYLPAGFVCPLRIMKIEVEPTTIKSSELIVLNKLSSIAPGRRKNLKTKRMTKICFDCETIEFEGSLVPYLIYAKIIPTEEPKASNININEEEQEIDACENQIFGPPAIYYPVPAEFLWSYPLGVDFKKENFLGGIKFAQWILEIVNGIKNECTIGGEWYETGNVVRIFGFNNNNFDNHFVLDDLRHVLRGFKYSYSSRYGKVTKCSFYKSNHLIVELVDLVKWMPDKSLRDACKDYEEEINTPKLDVNILAYNDAIIKKKCFVEECEEKEMKIYINDYMPFIHKKLVAQFKNTGNNKIRLYDMVVYYCKIDVQSTLELYCILEKQLCNLVEELAAMGIFVSSSDFMDYISIPQLSFEILKETLRQQNENLLTLTNPAANEFYYASYFGGRVDYGCVGEYVGKEEIEYYDVTSEYSLAMTGYFPSLTGGIEDILVGLEVDLKKYQTMLDAALEKRNACIKEKNLHLSIKEVFEELNKVKGIFLCNIYAPEIVSTWGPVPYRYDDYAGTKKLTYLNCNQTNRALNTVHFRSLILAGWRVELLFHEFNTVFLQIGKTLKPFIDLIGKMKSEARLINKTKAKLLKMLLNSAQGKIAQKPTHLLHTQTGNNQDFGFEMQTNEKNIEFDWDRSYHYLSSFIGAEAGWILYSASYMLELDYIYEGKSNNQRCGAILYCDTDSLIFDSGLVNKDYVNFVCDEQIGEWNDEKSNYDSTWKKKYKKIDSVIILAKKSYFLIKKKKLEEKKLKGVLRREAQSMTYESVRNILREGKKQITFKNLAKSNINLNTTTASNNSLALHTSVDAIKRVFENQFKKTIAVETQYQKIESACADTVERNKVCLSDGTLNFAINSNKLPENTKKDNILLSTTNSIDETIANVIKNE